MRTKWISVFLPALLLTSTANAMLLFEQPVMPDLGLGFGSNGEPIPFSTIGQQIADDFTLGTTATLSEVTWFGAYHGILVDDPQVPPASPVNFTLRIFDDLAALPGAIVFEQNVQAMLIDTGLTVINPLGPQIPPTLKVFSFTTSLAGPTLAGGQKYHLSVLDIDASTDEIFAWSFNDRSQSATSASRVRDTGTWSAAGADMAFKISGDTSPAVSISEPNTLLLLSGGILVIGYGRRWRKPS